jgi:hypothetical protein
MLAMVRIVSIQYEIITNWSIGLEIRIETVDVEELRRVTLQMSVPDLAILAEESVTMEDESTYEDII